MTRKPTTNKGLASSTEPLQRIFQTVQKTTKQSNNLTTKRKWPKRSLWTLTTMLVLMNIVAVFHSYKFTHFSDNKSEKTKDPKQLTTGRKIKTLIFGVSNPRPENTTVPTTDYETIKLKSNKEY